MSTAIVKAEPTLLDALTTSEWSRALVDAVRTACCPKDIPDVDFYAFLKRCQASGLNPLIGEAHCIPRNDKNKGRIYTWQPSAEGMRARAGKFPDFVSVDGAAVFEKDLCSIDAGSGVVVHKMNAAAPRGLLTGAWARVTKKDAQPTVVWLARGTRGGNSDFWSKDEAGQLRKCAVVAALREAYPVAFGGAYIAEEMDSAPVASRMDAIAGEVVAAEVAPPAPPAGPVVEFGAWKGRAISSLTEDLREEVLREGEWILTSHQKMSPKVRAKLEANVARIRGDAPYLPERAASTSLETLEAREAVPADEPTDEMLAADRAQRAQKEKTT